MKKAIPTVIFILLSTLPLYAQTLLGGAIYADGAMALQEGAENGSLFSMGGAAHAFFIGDIIHGPIVGGGSALVGDGAEALFAYRLGIPFELFETWGSRYSAGRTEYFDSSDGFISLDALIGYTARLNVDSGFHLPWIAVGLSRWDEIFEVSALVKLEQVKDTLYLGIHFRMGMSYLLEAEE